MRRTMTIVLLCLGWANALQAQCDINELFVEPSECENGFFQVHLNFNVVNPAGDLFGVMGNGTDYGTFPYDSMPITIGPLAGDGVTEWEFVVTDQNDMECQAVYVLGVVDCCAFTEVVVDPTTCTNSEVFSALLNFNHTNTGGFGFDVFNANGGSLGFFSYDDLPVTVEGIPSVGEGFTHITICDNDNPDCCETVEFQSLDCNLNDCEIFNVDVLVGDCENGLFFVTLGFNFQNVSANFTVTGNGNTYGTFPYTSLPITIGPLQGDGMTVYEFVVQDAEFDGCSDFAVILPVDCPDPVCGFESLVVDPMECSGNGTYSLFVNFIPEGVSNQGFDVYAGNTLVGFFLYADLPIIVEEFPDGDGPVDEITICDNDNPTCCTSLEFDESLNCNCAIFELEAEAFACDSVTNTFALYIDFGWQGNAETFNVFKGDALIGIVEGADLPDTLYGLTDDGGGALIRVCAVNFPDCCAAVEIDVPQCGDEPCDIFDLVAEAFACDSVTNTFALYIDFGWQGNAETFNVYKEEVLIGIVNGADLPDTLYGLTDDGGGALIRVCAVNFPDCCTAVDINTPQCGEEPCDIFELVAEAFDCDTTTNTFALYINFQWTGTDETFDVFKGNQFIGTVVGANLPDTLLGLTDDGGNALIRVCAQSHPDCCASAEIAVPDCGPEEQCEIFEVGVDTGDCTSDSTFQVAITYLYEGFTNEFVELWTGDIYLGLFQVSVQPILIENFPWNGNPVMPLRICQNDHPECCRTIEFEVPDCVGPECGFLEVVGDPLECTTDSTFAALVNFDAFGFDGPVQIWAGDTYLGVFPQSTPLILLNIPEQDGGVVLMICQAENMDCCTLIEIEGLVCENVCSISNLTAVVSECDEGTFTVTLSFDFSNVGDLFSVVGNGTQYGEFSYDQVPLTLGPFEGDTTTHWEFAVANLANPLCLDFVDVGVVDCTTGLAGTAKSLPLEIFYTATGAHFIVPDDATEFSMWAYDGRTIVSGIELATEERVDMSKYIPVPGLYFVQVKSAERTYIGKVVGF